MNGRGRRRPTVVGEYAVVITIITIAVVATVPAWLPMWFVLAWLFSLDGSRGWVLLGLTAPVVLGVGFSALNIAALAGSRAARTMARTPVDREEWRWRTYWSAAGSAVAVGSLVAYIGVLLWSVVS